jgi:hypothetical protein
MSRSTALIFIATAFSIGIGLNLYFRSPSPDSQLKDLSLKPENQIIRHTAKLTSQAAVSIVNKSQNYKPNKDETVSLSAQISLQTPATKIDYEWILPEGLHAKSDQTLSGQMTVTNWREPILVPIEITNQTLENKKIFIRISASGPNQIDQLASAQYDTQNYLELQQEQADLMKRQEEYLQDLPDESKKFK